jgi:hypothetical protein
MTMLHVRFEGKSYDFGADQADVDRSMDDGQVRRATARLLEVDPSRLAGYQVDRPESGELIVRPQAVYG